MTEGKKEEVPFPKKRDLNDYNDWRGKKGRGGNDKYFVKKKKGKKRGRGMSFASSQLRERRMIIFQQGKSHGEEKNTLHNAYSQEKRRGVFFVLEKVIPQLEVIVQGGRGSTYRGFRGMEGKCSLS